MNLFRKEKPAVLHVVAPVKPNALELAEREVEDADSRIAALGREWRSLQDKYNVLIDRDGRVVSAIVPDGISRDELDRLVFANWHARSVALTEFHRKLSVWAGLKGATNATNC